MPKNKINLDSDIEAIKWPKDIGEILKAKSHLIGKLWDIYEFNVHYVIPTGYIGRQLLDLRGIDLKMYRRINAVLKKNGFPDLRNAPKMVAKNEQIRNAEVAQGEGGSSG